MIYESSQRPLKEDFIREITKDCLCSDLLEDLTCDRTSLIPL